MNQFDIKYRMKILHIFGIFVITRLSSVLFVQTWYVPDEYWQSLEVAHKLVFEYGHLTWEWIFGIRSYTYPLLIAILYKILYIFDADNVFTLVSINT